MTNIQEVWERHKHDTYMTIEEIKFGLKSIYQQQKLNANFFGDIY